jgi:hypothetical protein
VPLYIILQSAPSVQLCMEMKVKVNFCERFLLQIPDIQQLQHAWNTLSWTTFLLTDNMSTNIWAMNMTSHTQDTPCFFKLLYYAMYHLWVVGAA